MFCLTEFVTIQSHNNEMSSPKTKAFLKYAIHVTAQKTLETNVTDFLCHKFWF